MTESKKEYVFIHRMDTTNCETEMGYNHEFRIEFDAPDCTPQPIITQFRLFLKACGYSEGTIENYLGEG